MRLALLLLTLLALHPRAARGQTLDGQVVDSASGKPVPKLRVLLLAITDSTETELDSTSTDARGLFQLLAPAEGRYQLEFGASSLGTAMGMIETLVGDTTISRRYAIPYERWVAQRPLFEFEVEEPVIGAKGNRAPRYPDHLRSEGVEGCVLAQFVVDTTGRMEPATFKVLRATNPGFTAAVRTAVTEHRYTPARRGRVAVRQLVQQPFIFEIDWSAWRIPDLPRPGLDGRIADPFPAPFPPMPRRPAGVSPCPWA